MIRSHCGSPRYFWGVTAASFATRAGSQRNFIPREFAYQKARLISSADKVVIVFFLQLLLPRQPAPRPRPLAFRLGPEDRPLITGLECPLQALRAHRAALADADCLGRLQLADLRLVLRVREPEVRVRVGRAQRLDHPRLGLRGYLQEFCHFSFRISRVTAIPAAAPIPNATPSIGAACGSAGLGAVPLSVSFNAPIRASIFSSHEHRAFFGVSGRNARA